MVLTQKGPDKFWTKFELWSHSEAHCFLQVVLRFLSTNTMRFQKVTNLNPWSTNACQKRHGEDNLTHHNFDGQKFCLIWRVIINNLLKFIYSEKATKFCEIFTLLLTSTT